MKDWNGLTPPTPEQLLRQAGQMLGEAIEAKHEADEWIRDAIRTAREAGMSTAEIGDLLQELSDEDVEAIR